MIEYIENEKFQDLIGKKFNMLTIVEIYKPRDRDRKCLCRCDCGKMKKCGFYDLKAEKTKSCGCLHLKKAIERLSKVHKKNSVEIHGMANTPEYRTWGRIKTRCYNKARKDYPNYGGRGIKVCDKWLNSFTEFYIDMGEKPEPKHLYSLDRIDNDGDYEPGNCRWITVKEQNNNTRLIDFNKGLAGKKFNRLTIKQLLPIITGERNRRCLCECECGNTLTPFISCVKRGHTKSCGCLKRESCINNITSKKAMNHQEPAAASC